MMAFVHRWLLWWWARKDEPSEFRFPQALQNAKRILILMPDAIEALRQSEAFLSRVPRVFPKTHVTLIYPPKSMVARFYNPYGFQSVVPESKQVGWLGVPRKSFLKKVFEKPFDIVITLNRSASVFFGIMTIASKAPVRIGLPDGMGAPFVNVELRHGREKADTKTEFILFVEMLRKLAAPPVFKPGPPVQEKQRVTKRGTVV
jgi:hypothetical protein